MWSALQTPLTIIRPVIGQLGKIFGQLEQLQGWRRMAQQIAKGM
jgi:hypothetical protein